MTTLSSLKFSNGFELSVPVPLSVANLVTMFLSSRRDSHDSDIVVQELKWEVRHGRTMGIHVSPTTAINDIVFDSSSSWGLKEWKDVLDPLVA